jgi:hypothetical protein
MTSRWMVVQSSMKLQASDYELLLANNAVLRGLIWCSTRSSPEEAPTLYGAAVLLVDDANHHQKYWTSYMTVSQ